jgi:hypothetical protein
MAKVILSAGIRGGGAAGAAPEHGAVEQGVPHHAVAAVHAAGDLTGCEQALDGGAAVPVDHQPAVLVVKHGIGQDRFGQRVDPGVAVAPHHVGQHLVGHLRLDPGGVEEHRRAAVRRGQAAALVALLHDRLRDRIAWRQLVDEPLALAVHQQRAVAARGLGDRVALQRRGPGAAVGVVLQRVLVAGRSSQLACQSGHLAGGAGLVGGQHAAAPGLRIAAPAGRQDDAAGLDRGRLTFAVDGRGEVPVGLRQGRQRRVAVDLDALGGERAAQGVGDGVAGAVAHLQQAPGGRAAAAGQPVAVALA